MRWMVLATSIGLCVGAASCTLDFAEPDAADPAALLNLWIDASARAEGRIVVHASLDPGTGVDGTDAEVPDPTLTILGIPFPADSVYSDERLRLVWSDTIPIDASAPPPVAVYVPAVEGRALPAPLTLVLRREAEGSTRGSWTAGQDLVLPLRPARVDEGRDRVLWHLFVSGWSRAGTLTPLLTLEARSPIGDTIRLSAGSFSLVDIDSVTAKLRYDRTYGSATADSAYITRASLNQELSWVLQVSVPEGALEQLPRAGPTRTDPSRPRKWRLGG